MNKKIMSMPYAGRVMFTRYAFTGERDCLTNPFCYE